MNADVIDFLESAKSPARMKRERKTNLARRPNE